MVCPSSETVAWIGAILNDELFGDEEDLDLVAERYPPHLVNLKLVRIDCEILAKTMTDICYRTRIRRNKHMENQDENVLVSQ
jgi:hypothetical protein